jgi:hypothetical protein
MSDESLQSRLEAEARNLPALTGPEKRGFRAEDALGQPPPEIPPPAVPGLDFSKPEGEPSCPICGKPLPADATPKIIEGGVFLCCRTCQPLPKPQ